MTESTSPDPDDLEKLGIASALIKARTELGMTQAQLSEDSGLSRSAIKGYETGRNMPGARELKALCRVLKVSPNVLLFGTESPFSGQSPEVEGFDPGLRLLMADPEAAKKARARLAFMSDLLTSEEVASLLNLVQALAVARHGADVVEQRIVGADLMAGVGMAFQRQAARLASGEEKEVDTERWTAELEDFMDRQGHKPKEPQKRG